MLLTEKMIARTPLMTLHMGGQLAWRLLNQDELFAYIISYHCQRSRGRAVVGDEAGIYDADHIIH